MTRTTTIVAEIRTVINCTWSYIHLNVHISSNYLDSLSKLRLHCTQYLDNSRSLQSVATSLALGLLYYQKEQVKQTSIITLYTTSRHTIFTLQQSDTNSRSEPWAAGFIAQPVG